MISKIGNQQNSPNFKGLFKLTDARLWTKESKPTELYQTFVETVQYQYGFFVHNSDFFTCEKKFDMEIMDSLDKLGIAFKHKDKELFDDEFKAATIPERTIKAYDWFTKQP